MNNDLSLLPRPLKSAISQTGILSTIAPPSYHHLQLHIVALRTNRQLHQIITFKLQSSYSSLQFYPTPSSFSSLTPTSYSTLSSTSSPLPAYVAVSSSSWFYIPWSSPTSLPFLPPSKGLPSPFCLAIISLSLSISLKLSYRRSLHCHLPPRHVHKSPSNMSAATFRQRMFEKMTERNRIGWNMMTDKYIKYGRLVELWHCSGRCWVKCGVDAGWMKWL